jgi:hypothetical protein
MGKSEAGRGHMSRSQAVNKKNPPRVIGHIGKSKAACWAKNCLLVRDWKKSCTPAKLVCEKWAAVSAGEASSKDAGLSVRTGNKETDRKTGTVNE